MFLRANFVSLSALGLLCGLFPNTSWSCCSYLQPLAAGVGLGLETEPYELQLVGGGVPILLWPNPLTSPCAPQCLPRTST